MNVPVRFARTGLPIRFTIMCIARLRDEYSFSTYLVNNHVQAMFTLTD